VILQASLSLVPTGHVLDNMVAIKVSGVIGIDPTGTITEVPFVPTTAMVLLPTKIGNAKGVSSATS
jgi:hypothetical protein